GNGNYVTVWTGDQQDGSGLGIYQQLFGSTADLPRQPNPVLDDVTSARQFGVVELSSPQIIDPSVLVQDDGANFDGGSLWVYFTSGYEAGGSGDTLAINHQGSDPSQIGVAGNTVSFGGTVIGTFAGGTSSAPLVVSFNAQATADAVRHLIQNLSYTYDAAPVPVPSTRTLALRLFDGDGGASLPATVAITISPDSPPVQLVLSDLETSVTISESAAQAGVVLDENVQLAPGDGSFDSGTLTVTLISGGQAEDQLAIRDQGTGAGEIGFNAGSGEVSYEGVPIGLLDGVLNGAAGSPLLITFNASASAPAIERVIENLRYQTTSDGPLASRSIEVVVRDANAVQTAQTMTINVTPEIDGAQALTGDEQVNTWTAGDQLYPFVAGLVGANAGGYVVVWQSSAQDGSGWGVHGQRYNAQGMQLGSEFQVNSYTAGDQTEAKVAALADGGFVVVWRSEGQDGSSGGVYAQRYDADGDPAGSEFLASTPAYTTADQTHPQALGLPNGNFVITWADEVRDSSWYGSFGQIFAPDGTRVGADFQLNTYLPYHQYAPYLAAVKDDAGTVGVDETGFIAVWESLYQDGSGWGVYAQRFDQNGGKLGDETLVNSNTSGDQFNPDVAVLADGHIVVVWQDNSDASVRGQLYTAGGVSIGGEFVVSRADYNSDHGGWPHVTELASGGFVVSWDGYSSPTDGDYGVYAQQFDAAGNKVDGPIQLNATTANNQHYPNLAGLGSDNFVAVWEGNYHETDGNASHGIFQRVFGTPGSLARQAPPELIDLEPSVSFNENDVNAAAQVIDPGVRVVDVDSPDLDGGRLVVSVISGYGAVQAFNPLAAQQDNFSIRNQGSAIGQVGFDSLTGVVRYGGTVIGSLVSDGQNGADLVVQFNAAAGAAAVEAVIENLTYRNPASDPAATRTVSVVVADGDGGQSVRRTIDIAVTAQTDGAVRLLTSDQQVNTYSASNQELPAIAALQGAN
ncbi:MAG TPA: hypothetical protein PK279_12395, partial [Accumulibacter sp.]|nr:hypothetical protein [Accumulibacter sp.]